MQPPYLSVENIHAGYVQSDNVLNGISFELTEGDLACLVGPSGCGKTTILRAISGFHPIEGGEIRLDGLTLSTAGSSISPEKREIGMVFQDHALFPHMTIAENVGFGISRSMSKAQKKDRVDEMLSLVGLDSLASAFPHEISGGQSQRTALARAIAPRPKLLLMDEPFSNLDSSLRESLGQEIHGLLKEAEMTSIMVTHDQFDAFALADKIGVVNSGTIQQWGSAFDLYHAPNNRFVADFIGEGGFIPGQVSSENSVSTEIGNIKGKIVNPVNTGDNVALLIRPDDVVYDPNGAFSGTIMRKAFRGAHTLYKINVGNSHSLLSLIPSHDDFEVGETITLNINADHLVCFAT